MAKPKFPTKPCPKCGKPIHARKMKHEECGWEAVAMPAAAKVTKPAAKTAASNGSGKGMSKMAAVRQILQESGNDTKPAEIASQLKQKFKIAMSLAMISNYKSTILSSTKRKIGRPKGSTNTPKAAPSSKTVSAAISVDDIRAVKKLIEQLGAEKVRELADVLAK